MDLQLALLIVGAILIAGVAIVSLPSVGVKLSSLFAGRKENRQVKGQRETTSEPSLGDDAVMLDGELQLDAEVLPLFNDQKKSDDAFFEQVDAGTEPLGLDKSNANQSMGKGLFPDTFIDTDEGSPFESKTDEPLGVAKTSAIENVDEGEQNLTPEPTSPSEVQTTPTAVFKNLRQIDYWAKLSVPKAQTKKDILQLLANATRAVPSPVLVHGLSLQDQQWYDFGSLMPKDQVQEFVVSFQLLHQGGALTLAQLERFCDEIKEAAKKLDAPVTFLAPAVEAAIQSSNLAALYANCQGDIELIVLPVDNGALHGATVENCAKIQGLDFYEGRYARFKQAADKHLLLYYLQDVNGDAFKQDMAAANQQFSALKFVMSLATSEKPATVARQMLDEAKAYASRVNGALSVYEGQEYDPKQLEELQAHVNQVEAQMQKLGITAGSDEAKRLFS